MLSYERIKELQFYFLTERNTPIICMILVLLQTVFDQTVYFIYNKVSMSINDPLEFQAVL